MKEFTSELRLRLGEEDGLAFQEFLQKELERGNGPKELSVTFKKSVGTTGGFGYDIPPEVVVAVVLVASNVASGFATEFGKQAGKFLWDKLREFFAERMASGEAPSKVEVRVGNQRKHVDIHQDSEDPPEIFNHLGKPTSEMGDQDEPA